MIIHRSEFKPYLYIHEHETLHMCEKNNNETKGKIKISFDLIN